MAVVHVISHAGFFSFYLKSTSWHVLRDKIAFFSLPLQDHFQQLSVDSLNEESATSGRQCEARAGTLDPEAEVRWFFSFLTSAERT